MHTCGPGGHTAMGRGVSFWGKSGEQGSGRGSKRTSGLWVKISFFKNSNIVTKEDKDEEGKREEEEEGGKTV